VFSPLLTIHGYRDSKLLILHKEILIDLWKLGSVSKSVTLSADNAFTLHFPAVVYRTYSVSCICLGDVGLS
jgi:hypothetical protein